MNLDVAFCEIEISSEIKVLHFCYKNNFEDHDVRVSGINLVAHKV